MPRNNQSIPIKVAKKCYNSGTYFEYDIDLFIDGGVFLYCGFQIAECLLPGGLQVVVVVPAVGLRQPGLQLWEVVWEEMTGVRY